jgi:S-adenosylmethionine decarboxylase
MASHGSTARLGLVADRTLTEDLGTGAVAQPSVPSFDNDKDYFVERNGLQYAGTHLLLEFWDASNLDQVRLIEAALCEGAVAAGATILHSHMHYFSPNGGVSGVVVLAESHISIHTWPERDYAAIDLFMCGECDPYLALPALRRAMQPGKLQVSEHKRGLVA